MRGEFSVVQFFEDDSYEFVRRFVDAEEAVIAARHYTRSVGAKLGIVRRLIITDGGDFTNFEWKFGEGVTYPPDSTRETVMGRKVVIVFDEHDFAQIELLAKLRKLKVSEQIKRMCRAQLDRTAWAAREAGADDE